MFNIRKSIFDNLEESDLVKKRHETSTKTEDQSQMKSLNDSYSNKNLFYQSEWKEVTKCKNDDSVADDMSLSGSSGEHSIFQDKWNEEHEDFDHNNAAHDTLCERSGVAAEKVFKLISTKLTPKRKQHSPLYSSQYSYSMELPQDLFYTRENQQKIPGVDDKTLSIIRKSFGCEHSNYNSDKRILDSVDIEMAPRNHMKSPSLLAAEFCFYCGCAIE